MLADGPQIYVLKIYILIAILECVRVLMLRGSWLYLVCTLDSPDSCDKVDCDEENEVCVELQNEEVKVAHCIPTSEFHLAKTDKENL